MSLELARDRAPLQVVVGFHPGLYSRRAFEDEMRTAGVADWRIEVYGGVGHSFTNPAIDARGFSGFAYDERADRRSWQSMLDLFRERLDAI